MALAGIADVCASVCPHRQLSNTQPARHAWNTRLLRQSHQRPQQAAVDACKGCRRRFRGAVQALDSPEGSADEPLDIDQLAKRLSQEAEKARQRQSEDTVSDDSIEGESLAAELAQAARESGAQRPVESGSPFGYEVSWPEPESGFLYHA